MSMRSFVPTLYSCVLAWQLLSSGVTAWSGNASPSRRSFFVQTASVGSFVLSHPANAAVSTADLIEDLKLSKARLEPINELLEQKEWEKVRSILKVPPVNKLWNLGDVSYIASWCDREAHEAHEAHATARHLL